MHCPPSVLEPSACSKAPYAQWHITVELNSITNIPQAAHKRRTGLRHAVQSVGEQTCFNYCSSKVWLRYFQLLCCRDNDNLDVNVYFGALR